LQGGTILGSGWEFGWRLQIWCLSSYVFGEKTPVFSAFNSVYAHFDLSYLLVWWNDLDRGTISITLFNGWSFGIVFCVEHQSIIRNLKMTIDKSLKVKAGSVKDRNVLKRSERLAQVMAAGKWNEESTILGMAKTRVRKIAMKKKKKVKGAEEGK